MASTLFIGDVAFCAGVGFLSGILTASFDWNMGSVIAWTAVCTATALILKIIPGINNLRVVAWFAAIGLGVFFFGALYYRFFLDFQAKQIALPAKKSGSFLAIVSDEPKSSEKAQLLTVSLEAPYAGTITVFAPPASNFGYGDELKIEGVITPSKDAWQSAAIFPKTIKNVAHHKAFLLREILIRGKVAIIEKYNALLQTDEATLLGGITFGAKTDFKQELKTAMATSGTTHMVAISGYNITIVIVAVEQMLGGFLARRAKFLVTIALIILFILMTGLQSSAIRAAIMGCMALIAKESGRSFSMRNGVTLTAVIMVLIQPTVLVHDAGFQLTFMSLLGIVCFLEPIKKLFRFSDAGFLDWKENAVTTFSAQLGVMPILIGVFGQFSMTAIVANVLVLGTVPMTMLLGFVLAVLSFVSYPISFLIAKLTWLFLAYQLFMIRLFAALAVPLPIPFDSALIFTVYYASLGWFAYHSYEK